MNESVKDNRITSNRFIRTFYTTNLEPDALNREIFIFKNRYEIVNSCRLKINDLKTGIQSGDASIASDTVLIALVVFEVI